MVPFELPWEGWCSLSRWALLCSKLIGKITFLLTLCVLKDTKVLGGILQFLVELWVVGWFVSRILNEGGATEHRLVVLPAVPIGQQTTAVTF